jgi:hypothetical protein
VTWTPPTDIGIFKDTKWLLILGVRHVEQVELTQTVRGLGPMPENTLKKLRLRGFQCLWLRSLIEARGGFYEMTCRGRKDNLLC